MTDRVGEVRDQTVVRPRPRVGRDRARQLRALISLLADDDEKIVAMVWEQLLRVGERALPYLRAASEDPDPRLRLRARHVAYRVQLRQLERRFRRLARRPAADFDLEHALTLVAQIEYPELTVADVRRRLEELAEGLRPQMPTGAEPRVKLQRLIAYLFEDRGFRGNRRDYYDPQNSFIHKVIDRRLGIPITLSAVTILVGRRLGLPLYGVGLPKHFLVKYQDHAAEIYFDPFQGGRLLTGEECTEILTREGYYVRESFVAEYLAIASPRDMVIRILRNLIINYSKLRDKVRVRRIIRYVQILRERAPAR